MWGHNRCRNGLAKQVRNREARFAMVMRSVLIVLDVEQMCTVRYIRSSVELQGALTDADDLGTLLVDCEGVKVVHGNVRVWPARPRVQVSICDVRTTLG